MKARVEEVNTPEEVKAKMDVKLLKEVKVVKEQGSTSNELRLVLSERPVEEEHQKPSFVVETLETSVNILPGTIISLEDGTGVFVVDMKEPHIEAEQTVEKEVNVKEEKGEEKGAKVKNIGKEIRTQPNRRKKGKILKDLLSEGNTNLYSLLKGR